MFIADTLSRDPDVKQSVCTRDLDNTALAVHMLVAVSPVRMNKFKAETATDPVLQKIALYSRKGWPQHRSAVDPVAHPYWQYRLEIHEEEGLLFRGPRLIIPKTQRRETLLQIHASHQGIVSCKSRARECLYWPGMTTDIEQLILSCNICQQTAKANQAEPIQSHEVPERPWEKVGIDLFQSKGKMHLAMVDYHSKFVEVRHLSHSSAAEPVILAIKSIFAIHGIASEIITDNGPPFNSAAFAEFAYEWDFTHRTSSPLYPKSNGMIERSIQTTKLLIRKAHMTGTDPYLALLNYRATPNVGNLSPAEMLMGRQLRTLIPSKAELLLPRFNTNHTVKLLKENQEKCKKFSNQHTKSLPPLAVNQRVMVQMGQRHWVPATVTKIQAEPRSYEVTTVEGRKFRRNRVAIRERAVQNCEETNGITEVVSNENAMANAEDHSKEPISIDPECKGVDTVNNAPVDRYSRYGRKIKVPARYSE